MKIIIIGAKGAAVDIGEQIVDAQVSHRAPVELLGWAIDDESLGPSVNGYPVLCRPSQAASRYPHADVKLIFALYKPELMKERTSLLNSYGIEPDKFATFIHPSAYVARSATLGPGTVVLAHAIVSANVRIGAHCIITSGSMIGHDSVVHNNVFVATSFIGSQVTVRNGVFIGLNSAVNENVEIGDYAFVGLSTSVLRGVPPERVVYGNPARDITQQVRPSNTVS